MIKRKVGEYYWAYFKDRWRPVEYSLDEIAPCFYTIGNEYPVYPDTDDEFIKWGNRLTHYNCHSELMQCLQWYIDNDDTMNMEDNKTWLEGKKRAEQAIKNATSTR